MVGVLLYHHEYPYSTHDIKTESTTPVVYIKPEYVYDAFQMLI